MLVKKNITTKKIAFYTNGKFISYFLIPLINHWLDKQHRLYIYYYGEEIGKINEIKNSPNLKLVRLKGTRFGDNLIGDFSALFEFNSSLKKDNPEILISWSIKALFYCLFIASIRRNINYYAIISGLGLLVTKKSKKMIILSYLYRLYVKFFSKISKAKLLFMNKDDPKFFNLSQRYLVKGLLPGQGIDTRKFFPKHNKRKHKRIGFVARLIISKGIIDFVKAAEIVKSINPEVEFVAVGSIENSFDGVSEKQINDWESKGVLKWEGHVDNILAKYNSFDILCLPSYREGLSQSIIEGMACGLPIITTNVPGCRDLIVNGENGILISPRSPKELADKIIYLLRNDALSNKMGDRNRELAINKYSLSAVMKKYDSLLKYS